MPEQATHAGRSRGAKSINPKQSSGVRSGEPYHFFGTVWHRPPAYSLRELVVQGRIARAAAVMLAALAKGSASIVIVSSDAGVGKSTLLASLRPYAPDDTDVHHLRGPFEPFAFLDSDAVWAAAPKRLLIANEISPHLPVYVWGDAARRAIELSLTPGYTLWATAHAEGRADLLRQWQSPLIGVDGRFSPCAPVVVTLTGHPVGTTGPRWNTLIIEVGDLHLEFGVPAPGSDARLCRSHLDALCHAVWKQVEAPLASAYLSRAHLYRFMLNLSRHLQYDEPTADPLQRSHLDALTTASV